VGRGNYSLGNRKYITKETLLRKCHRGGGSRGHSRGEVYRSRQVKRRPGPSPSERGEGGKKRGVGMSKRKLGKLRRCGGRKSKGKKGPNARSVT